MRIIVGLGNPGQKYENTRHNVGFLFIDALAKSLNMPDFEFNKKLNSQVSEVRLSPSERSPEGRQKFPEVGLRLAKPQTFMNKSGLAAAALIKFYKIKPINVLVVHDDIDILWENFKLSFGRSSAGHKGAESIIKSLKTKYFWRLRIGIQPIISSKQKVVSSQQVKIKADKVILKKFTPAEEKTLKSTIKSAIEQIEEMIM